MITNVDNIFGISIGNKSVEAKSPDSGPRNHEDVVTALRLADNEELNAEAHLGRVRALPILPSCANPPARLESHNRPHAQLPATQMLNRLAMRIDRSIMQVIKPCSYK